MSNDLTKYSLKEMRKILFIFNAIEDGWSVKKKNDFYVFSKHKNKEKQIYEEKYLEKFINKYFNL
tara:strand:- start:244 stop:438 length:195 start_codon:yes stop_codon:yes gene_type:complete